MKQKMKEAIAKLRNTTIATLVTYNFYNIYLLSKVYFGCGVMCLSPPQEKELMTMNQ